MIFLTHRIFTLNFHRIHFCIGTNVVSGLPIYAYHDCAHSTHENFGFNTDLPRYLSDLRLLRVLKQNLAANGFAAVTSHHDKPHNITAEPTRTPSHNTQATTHITAGTKKEECIFSFVSTTYTRF
jgi:hypothetical protein